MTSSECFNKSINSLVEATDAILRGEFDQNLENIDAEGVLKELANRINSMVVNMKSVQISLSSAGEHAPDLVDKAHNIVDLMKKTAGQVLDKSDKISALADQLDQMATSFETSDVAVKKEFQETVTALKDNIFDIIATQTFQDVARQKMEKMIQDMNQVRDWLIESLVILNIKKDYSPQNLEKKTNLLRDVTEPSTPESDKQDLVDDLLAEFGF